MKQNKTYNDILYQFIQDRDNGVVLDKEQFIAKVEELCGMAPADWRRGQAVFNTVSLMVPTVQLREDEYHDFDPFYNDIHIDKFLDWAYMKYIENAELIAQHKQVTGQSSRDTYKKIARLHKIAVNTGIVVTVALFISGCLCHGDTSVMLWACSVACGLFTQWIWDNLARYDNSL